MAATQTSKREADRTHVEMFRDSDNPEDYFETMALS
jgi:hypothetical protein